MEESIEITTQRIVEQVPAIYWRFVRELGREENISAERIPRTATIPDSRQHYPLLDNKVVFVGSVYRKKIGDQTDTLESDIWENTADKGLDSYLAVLVWDPSKETNNLNGMKCETYVGRVGDPDMVKVPMHPVSVYVADLEGKVAFFSEGSVAIGGNFVVGLNKVKRVRSEKAQEQYREIIRKVAPQVQKRYDNVMQKEKAEQKEQNEKQGSGTLVPNKHELPAKQSFSDDVSLVALLLFYSVMQIYNESNVNRILSLTRRRFY